MTTKTGSSEMRWVPTGPGFGLAVGGACVQLAVLGGTWAAWTPLGACLAHPLVCLEGGTTGGPWARSVLFCGAAAVATWLGSLRTLAGTGVTDCSIVDRLWSILPPLYCCYWAGAYPASHRALLMASLAGLWGARLTSNFWLKGGFSGGEDYRWAVVRTWYPGWRWQVFNFFFVCFFQHFLLLAFAAPAAAAALAPRGAATELRALDGLATLLFLLLCAGEAAADAQMFAFQTEKYRRIAAGEDPGPYRQGFLDRGLWAYSRHPNYFCEVSLWWAFYLFSVPATGHWLNWTAWGPLFLTLLFVAPGASVDVAEAISLSKYPGYAAYQGRVSRFLPMPPRPQAE